MGNEIAGDLIVSEDVIADVAGHAALECYGVVGMAAPNAADGLAKILSLAFAGASLFPPTKRALR